MATYTVSNPWNDAHLGEYVYADGAAIAGCLQTLRQGEEVQRSLVAHERSDILRRLAQLLQAHREELAALVTDEIGKTISDARVELDRAINTTIASAEEARQIAGEALDSDAYPPTRGRIGVVVWRPLGTVLCITPFNFPLNIAMHKLGPAFAAGNAVMFKPAPQNTASAQRLVELCYEAGMPRQTLQLCIPDVPDMSDLVAHPQIKAINFTGGTVAARAIAASAGFKKLLLELGGNDPLIIMPDADIDAAVSAAINQRFATAGQRCTAAKRLFIHGEVYTRFREALLAKTTALAVGDPALDETFVGPVIHAKAADEISARIEDALARGAKLACGHRREGTLLWPTVIEDVPDDASLITEETFGPVLPLRRFENLEEVIALVNASPYGLQAGVFTQNLSVIRRLFDELEVGLLASNDGPGFRAEHFPFGGVKDSGVGREGVKYAIREMSYQKTLVI
ncbi:aldehyde dehydrogenase family protein [Congregibacter variabilis]|uniref:Aldehyde dehydrogenase family protein n=1 Tax=Congregibacter variabilis TaxID=3081200 RepID=A0ABZ0I9H0_9GAMM|nr:aldehyde dehydrogenase family protein [Congregibacter sp. IMCC43200]